MKIQKHKKKMFDNKKRSKNRFVKGKKAEIKVKKGDLNFLLNDVAFEQSGYLIFGENFSLSLK